MIRVRKLVLAIAAASALTSGTAHALGLGEIDLQSSLSQPLVAEIELPSEDTLFERPEWLGEEITHDGRFTNAYLSQHPYATWK